MAKVSSEALAQVLRPRREVTVLDERWRLEWMAHSK